MHHTKSLSVALISSACLMPQIATAYAIPIGDGKISTSPRKGNVYACQTNFNPNAPGAQASGDWIDAVNGTWDTQLKPYVVGSVAWPSEISITTEGNTRVISGNGLPNHQTGVFPVASSDEAYQYDRNPNQITVQNVLLRFDVTPQIAAEPTCVPMGMIGFALSGAAVFNALDARGDDAPAHEIQDKCDGHPERGGEYHYHSEPVCVIDTQSGPNGHSDLMGYALDGFGIFGKNESSGGTLISSDLDACHGHVGNVAWDGQSLEMYHYHFTKDYPYTVGCFVGVVTQTQAQETRSRMRQGNGQSAERRTPPQNRQGGPRRPGQNQRP